MLSFIDSHPVVFVVLGLLVVAGLFGLHFAWRSK